MSDNNNTKSLVVKNDISSGGYSKRSVRHLYGKMRFSDLHRGAVHVCALHCSYTRVSRSNVIFIASGNDNKMSLKTTLLLEALERKL